MSFTARWTSTCADCGDDIKPGDEATYNSLGEVVHVSCPDPVQELRPVCMKCFIELPVSGVCSDCDS